MSKKNKKPVPLTVQNSLTKVLFIEKQLLTEDQNNLEIIEIELPRKKSMFVKANGTIFELFQFNEKHRSWFLDETVVSNGKIYLTSKVDPLFIFLQYLEQDCKTKVQPLDQILEGSAVIFGEVLKMKQMKLVADQKGSDDLKAFKFNEEKTLKWLRKKFEIIKNSLRDQKIISSGSSSMNFVKSSLEVEAVDEDAIAEAALGIISEYISLDLIEKLDEIYGISAKSKEPANLKRKSDVNGADGERKRIKVEEQENVPEESPTNVKVAQPKVTTKSKALEKAAKGSKSINSFFTKK